MIRIGIAGTVEETNPYLQALSTSNEFSLQGIFSNDQQTKIASIPSLPFGEGWLNDVDAVLFTSLSDELILLLETVLKEGRHALLTAPNTLPPLRTNPVLKMARESNVICMVGNEHHYHPVMLSSIHEIQLPLFIETQQLTTFNPSNPSIDVVSSLMMQDIQTVLRLVNSEIKHISASGVKVLSDTIDIANARLEFTNGTLANLTSSRISQKQMHLSRVFQKDCYHVLNFHQNQADKIYLDTTLPHQVALQAETKTIPTRSPYQGLLDDFQLSIKQQKNLGMRLDQSRKAQEICDTILKKINFLGDE